MKLAFGIAAPPKRLRPQPDPRAVRRFFPTLAASLAAVALLSAASVAGFHYGKSAEQQATLSAELEQPDRVVLHIGKSDPQQFVAALEYAEKFVREHESRDGEIAVIAHSTGIDLMRTGISPHEKRILALTDNHENVYFIACANAIRMLRNKGVDPVILDSVDTRKPAMDQIIERVQDGWTYIKVQNLLSEV